VSSTPSPLHGQLHAVHVVAETVQAHVASLAGGLVARGVRVTVCGPATAGSRHRFTDVGARFAPVEIAQQATPRADATVVAALRAACAGADVVHAHGLRAGALATVALAGRRTPLIVTRQGMVLAEGAGAGFRRLLERRVARAASVVLGVSSDLVERARELGARDARLSPVGVPAGSAVARLPEKTRAELGAVPGPLLLAAGRLEPHKGYGTLLDAARSWLTLTPRPVVAIVGEGSQRAALQRRIDAEHLPVRLLGAREDLHELLAAADLVVLPSRWEARAQIAQQALAAGVPLVATSVGGIPELVGEAAELVPYGDPQALAAAVAGLLTSPERRAALATAGIAQAATWPTEDDTVAQVLSIYDELTKGR
jgi:glycosyltransferase involved in cell wall biosynthesis